MKVLVLGNGLHTNKRILPALNKIEYIDSIIVGDRNADKESSFNKITRILNFNESVDSKHNYDLSIIATPPYNHIESFEKIKNISKRVLVEKPFSNDFDYIFGEELQNYIKNNLVFESLMYFHHPVWSKLKHILKSKNILTVESEFSVPHLSNKSFRYIKKLGGGSLNDQGIYPISLISELINDEYVINSLTIEKEKSFEVDLGGEINISYDNKTFIGKWGLGKEYKNYIKFTDVDCKEYFVNFFYSKPDNTEVKIETLDNNPDLKIGIYDQFKIMFEDALRDDTKKFEYSNNINLLNRYSLFKKVFEEI